MTEHALDAVTFLLEDAVLDDWLLAVRTTRNDKINFASAQTIVDGIGDVCLVSREGGRLCFGQCYYRIVRLADNGLIAGQMKGEWSSAGMAMQ